jgi:hypothetical protein
MASATDVISNVEIDTTTSAMSISVAVRMQFGVDLGKSRTFLMGQRMPGNFRND